MPSPAPQPKRRIAALASAVVALHLVGWGLALVVVAPRYPFMLGLAGLAYTFGLRHAFDADHIAAIDNVTRKLLQERRSALGTGFFFSLGHSTVVLLLTLAIALATTAVTHAVPALHSVGRYAGTIVSGGFLYLIGILNLLVLIDVYRVFRAMRRGGSDPVELESVLKQGGLMSRAFGRFYRVVNRSWHMYPIGFLFGLGFDTATEIGLLTTAGIAASKALPLYTVAVLPLVFAAGMSLMDTADGVLMSGAYAWAFKHPVRKVFYNLTITGISVLVALFVGTVEIASILTNGVFHLHGGVWDLLGHLDPQMMGYGVVALFIACWVIAAAVWRFGRIEERWSTESSPTS
ncbi:MAG TPA: HoxN/HupN/NixA family nickel/cobalt transporter [Gemmatimonadales bacterium]|nr:HoxN/HupN/NixA family nickel/cobalt transporter [Gemmatimonadales bacterium]